MELHKVVIKKNGEVIPQTQHDIAWTWSVACWVPVEKVAAAPYGSREALTCMNL